MFKDKLKEKVWPYVENICKKTTIHGLNIIPLPNLHVLERLSWLIIVTVAAVGAIILTLSNWNRFYSNPTVVSIQKDYRNWENVFPAATGCFNHKTSLEKAQKYILRTWNVSPSDEKYEYYLSFVETVTNTTYYSLDQFKKYQNDSTLAHIDMVDLVIKVHPDLSGTLVTIERKYKRDWQLVLIELGVCFTFNSKFANFFAIKPQDFATNNSNLLMKCHYLNGLCYARYDSDPKFALKYYIHSYLDVAHTTSKFHHDVSRSEEMEIDYKMIETFASPSIRYLSPSQRRCRFDDEPMTEDVPAYSSTLCYVICRHKLALELCKCKPFFYHSLGGKVCDIDGLICLSKQANYITRPPSEIGCNCPQPCNLISYLPQIPKYTKWEESGYFEERISFRWGLLHPTTKYKRNVIFGFGDLIVSLGGAANLFLGISSLSIFEIVYLICESIIKSYHNYKQKNILLVRKGSAK